MRCSSDAGQQVDMQQVTAQLCHLCPDMLNYFPVKLMGFKCMIGHQAFALPPAQLHIYIKWG